MICQSCTSAADTGNPLLHKQCEWPHSCGCQHRTRKQDPKPDAVDGALDMIRKRYGKYEDCPVCAAPTGEPCFDLRSLANVTGARTLKPHKLRKREG